MIDFLNQSTVFSSPPRLDDAYTAWNQVGSYRDYAEAQRAVDRLSDDGFPVEHLDIIGSDLRLLERVTGRLTNARAAAAGAAGGVWFGLLMGMLLGVFTNGCLARAACRRCPGRRGMGCPVRVPGARRHPRYP